MSDPLAEGEPGTPRFVIGIDLGTTNSAVAFADLRELTDAGAPRVRVCEVPQLVAEGEVASMATLPSFVYLLRPEERESGRFDLPWAKHPLPRGRRLGARPWGARAGSPRVVGEVVAVQ